MPGIDRLAYATDFTSALMEAVAARAHHRRRSERGVLPKRERKTSRLGLRFNAGGVTPRRVPGKRQRGGCSEGGLGDEAAAMHRRQPWVNFFTCFAMTAIARSGSWTLRG